MTTRVYIASKMSGLKGYNYDAFNRTAAHLRALGFEVENPAENDPPPCGSWRGYLTTALRQMLTCDVVVLLPGWEDSRGAQLEKVTAERVGMRAPVLSAFLFDHVASVKAFTVEMFDAIMNDAQPSEPDPECVPGNPSISKPLIPPSIRKGFGGDPWWVQTFAPPPDSSVFKGPELKATNPKDAIGIRKAAMSCVPANVLAEIGLGMMEGAAKYGRHNYRGAGVRASVYYDAAMRHLFAWWEGEDIDADSGLSHVTKLLADLTVLRDSMMRGNWTDDRPPRSAPFYPSMNVQAGQILDRHADKDPKHWTISDQEAA